MSFLFFLFLSCSHLFQPFFFRIQASDNGNVTISILSFTPTREDNGKVLICRAINEVMKHSIKETTLKLNIYCEYCGIIFTMLFSFIGPTGKLRSKYGRLNCLNGSVECVYAPCFLVRGGGHMTMPFDAIKCVTKLDSAMHLS